MKLLTAARELSTTMKSVTSAPALKPPPMPPIPKAEGADQVPLSSLAMTTPEPARAVSTNPTRKMEKMANPLALRRTVSGMTRSSPLTLGAGEEGRRDVG